MKISSTFLRTITQLIRVFDDTVKFSRHAVDYFIELVMAN